MKTIPAEISGVTVSTKANIYFEGKVISHTLVLGDDSRKTLGVIYPGSYHFATAAAEKMEIVAGSCAVVRDGESASATYGAGAAFEVPEKSGFTISVAEGICEYLCSFLP